VANFRDFVWNISPPWLRAYYGERFVGFTIGLMSDLISEGCAQALKASWLLTDTSPPDALPELGTERSMPRYFADTDDTYRDRLHGAWDAWLFAGNEEGTGGLGMVGQYNAMGLPNVTILPAENLDPRVARPAWRFELVPTVEVSGVVLTFTADDGSGNSRIAGTGASVGFTVGRKVYVIDTTLNDNNTGYEILTLPDANTIQLDGIVLSNEGPLAGATLDGTEFSRFAVIIEPGHGWTEWTYGSGQVYGGSDPSATYGSTATVGDVRTVKAIARKWSPGHAINPYIYVVIPDSVTGVGEYYGDPTHVYGDAAYFYGGSAIKWAHQV
jgi:hypothetical protein